jgi:hypothetical protein
MSDPRRREQRNTHLNASIVPVERALLARAEALDTAVSRHGADAPDWVPVETFQVIAAEFRQLAEELHWW